MATLPVTGGASPAPLAAALATAVCRPVIPAAGLPGTRRLFARGFFRGRTITAATAPVAIAAGAAASLTIPGLPRGGGGGSGWLLNLLGPLLGVLRFSTE